MTRELWASEVNIQNFRNFRNIKFSLGKGITLISGQNGSGKSNLLSLIASASGLSQKSELGSNFQPEFYDFFSIDEFEDYSQYKLFISFSDLNNQCVLRKKLTFKNDTKVKRGIRIIPRTTKIGEADHRKIRDIEEEGKSKYGVGGAARVPIATIYLSLSRMYPLGEKRESIKIKNLAARNILYQKEANVKFAEWYNKVIPNSIKKDGKLSIVEKAAISKRAAFFMSMNNNIPALSRSVGQDNLANIISAFVDVYLLSLKSDYKGALICIDEIDVSLHPDTQIRLLNLMIELSKTLNIQFVLTSHSLTFIKEISNKVKRKQEEYQIVYLKNPSDPYTAQNTEYYALKADLFNKLDHNVPLPKVYFEDEVGKELFVLLFEALNYQLECLESGQFRDSDDTGHYSDLMKSLKLLMPLRNIDKKIKMCAMELGCEVLIKLAEAKCDQYYRRIIFVLDGDARIKNGLNVKKPEVRDFLNSDFDPGDAKNRKHEKNVCFFPSYFAPESFLYKILYDLTFHQSEHELFWRALDRSEETEMYTADRISELLNTSKIDFTNDDVKSLFKNGLWDFCKKAQPLKYYYNSCKNLSNLIDFWKCFFDAYSIAKPLTIQNRYL